MRRRHGCRQTSHSTTPAPTYTPARASRAGGGSATVYQANDMQSDGALVALKVRRGRARARPRPLAPRRIAQRANLSALIPLSVTYRLLTPGHALLPGPEEPPQDGQGRGEIARCARSRSRSEVSSPEPILRRPRRRRCRGQPLPGERPSARRPPPKSSSPRPRARAASRAPHPPPSRPLYPQVTFSANNVHPNIAMARDVYADHAKRLLVIVVRARGDG